MDNEDAHGSEHSVDGVKYPLELHLVHRNIHDDTVAEAMEHENGMTVLGFKFKIVDDEKVVERDSRNRSLTLNCSTQRMRAWTT